MKYKYMIKKFSSSEDLEEVLNQNSDWEVFEIFSAGIVIFRKHDTKELEI